MSDWALVETAGAGQARQGAPGHELHAQAGHGARLQRGRSALAPARGPDAADPDRGHEHGQGAPPRLRARVREGGIPMALSYGVVEGWEQLPDGLCSSGRRRCRDRRRGSRLPDLPRRSPDHRLRPQGQLPGLVGRGAVHPAHARHHRRAGRAPVLLGRRQPHRAEVHAAGQAPADARHHEQAL